MGVLLLRMVMGICGVVLALMLHPGEGRPFPWLRHLVRWRLRRRRLSGLTIQEMLGLLPPGVRTIAQLVDRLTWSQTAKLLYTLPVLIVSLRNSSVQAWSIEGGAVLSKYPSSLELFR